MEKGSADSGWNASEFWAVFERSRIPMLLIDEERRYVAVNDATVEFYGFTRDELVGGETGRLLAPAERVKNDAAWDQLRRSGEYYGDRIVVRADGRRMRIQYAAHASTASGRWLVMAVILSARLEPDGPELIAADAASEARPPPPARPLLTARERDVVRLVALGAGTREVAAKLFVAPDTVRSHVRNAMSKLGAHTRAQLVAIALAEGLIEEQEPTKADGDTQEATGSNLGQVELDFALVRFRDGAAATEALVAARDRSRAGASWPRDRSPAAASWAQRVGLVEHHHDGHLVLRGNFAGHYVDVDEALHVSERGAGEGSAGGGLIGVLGGPPGIAVGIVLGAILGSQIGRPSETDSEPQPLADQLRAAVPRSGSAIVMIAAPEDVGDMLAAIGDSDGELVRQTLSDDEVAVLQASLSATPVASPGPSQRGEEAVEASESGPEGS